MGEKSFFIADFYCSKKKLIVEIDGKIHNTQIEYDEIRSSILEEMNYIIIRFENEQVLNNWETVEKELRDQIIKIKDRF